MWNIFKKQHKSYKSNDLSVYDRVINYIQSRDFTPYYKLKFFDLPFCYLYYYEKTDKYGNQLFFGFDGNEPGAKFGAYFICKNHMQEYLNNSLMQVQLNPEKSIEYIESYFHRKYGWDNNLEK